MVVINGKQCSLEFYRQLAPVTFFQRGRQVTQNRMSTTAVLVGEQGEVMDVATVKPYHKDAYNRKKANEAAVHKLAEQFEPTVKVQILRGFFNKP
jgi:adenylylsulfate kinase-like enzyme